MSPRSLLSLLLGLVATSACDPASPPSTSGEDPPRTAKADAPAPPTPAPAPASAPAEARQPSEPNAPVAKPEPVPEVPPPSTSPAVDETFDALVARLVEGLPPTSDPGAAAFVHYRAEEFAKAQPLFALAARQDTGAWKHPFNLACAGARGGDEAIARVALIEAVRRGGATVVRKAERDADLESVRDREWFLPVLRGETPPTAAVVAAAEVPASPADPTPADPTPADPTPADPAPAIAPAGDLPRGTTKELTKADLAALGAELATVHHAKAKVRGSIALAGDAGASIGFATYEVSRYEACVGEHADAKKAKKECRAKFRGNEEEGEPDQMQCTDQYVVRVASLAPLEVGKPERLTKRSCTMKVRRIEAHDFDADGQQEILLETLGHEHTPEFRTGEQNDYTRMFRVLRLDGTTQLALDVEWGEHMDTVTGTAHRLGLRDDDGDGHPDLVVASRDFEGLAGLELDDLLWPEPEPEGGDLEVGPTKVVRWTYDAAKDTWVDPAGSR
jgi:hypothetical protein